MPPVRNRLHHQRPRRRRLPPAMNTALSILFTLGWALGWVWIAIRNCNPL